MLLILDAFAEGGRLDFGRAAVGSSPLAPAAPVNRDRLRETGGGRRRTDPAFRSYMIHLSIDDSELLSQTKRRSAGALAAHPRHRRQGTAADWQQCGQVVRAFWLQ